MLPDSHFVWLTTGEPPKNTLDAFLLEPRDLWAQHGPEIIKAWARKHPGTRPHAWWAYEALESRWRVGGTGTPDFVALAAIVPQHAYGIPVRWISAATIRLYRQKLGIKLRADPFDAKDPPTFEAEGEFLRRHGLLAAHEAERVDLAPEILPRDFWPE